MKINRRYLAGGIWWGIVFGLAVVGLSRSVFDYLRSGQLIRGLLALFLALLCAVVGGALVVSVFSKD